MFFSFRGEMYSYLYRTLVYIWNIIDIDYDIIKDHL